jgi:hypothetical protein
VISNIGRGGRRCAPYVFTEQGVAMLSSVLRHDRSPRSGSKTVLCESCYNTRMDSAPRTEQELREEAVSRLKKKWDFRGHVFIYIAVNAIGEDEIRRETERLQQ